MASDPTRFISPQEYLARERAAAFRSEYYRGEVFAMAGASYNHTRVKDNIAGEAGGQLKSTDCSVLTSDLRERNDGIAVLVSVPRGRRVPRR